MIGDLRALDDIAVPVQAWKSRERHPPAKWVERNIYLSSRDGAVAGFFSHSRFPYSRKVLEVFADRNVERLILDWGTQLGKTVNSLSLILWVAENDPAPTMIATATEAAARAHFKTKLEPMLESVASIRRRLPPKTRRTWKVVDLGDMWIWYAWPGSKITVSDRSIKYLFINEIGLWAGPNGIEGDPVQMIFDRTKAFPHPGRKIVIEGKPTVEGECRITQHLEQSRRHDLYVPCPACGVFQLLRKGNSAGPGGVKWEEDASPGTAALPASERAAATVYWECEACEERHGEERKLPALRRSVWAPEGCKVEPDGTLQGDATRAARACGFHLSSLYSTISTWADFAKRWVEARDKPEDLQAVVNGWLAEPWKRGKRRTRADDVREHCDEYDIGYVPDDCLALVLSIDVQERDFWYVVRAWGWLGNSWLVSYGTAPSWEALDEIRETVWPGIGGELHRVGLTLIDSAYNSNAVYDWCRARSPSCIPIRGEHQYRQLSVVRIGELPDKATPIWHIDAGQIRDHTYFARLRKRLDEPGAWALPRNVREDYIRAICAWERREKKTAGGMRTIWESTSPGFEHWADCEFMQEAFAIVYRMNERRREPQSASTTPTDEHPPAGSSREWIVTHRE